MAVILMSALPVGPAGRSEASLSVILLGQDLSESNGPPTMSPAPQHESTEV